MWTTTSQREVVLSVSSFQPSLMLTLYKLLTIFNFNAHSSPNLIAMKHLLLSAGIALLSFPGYAQFTRTYTGALLATNPTIPGDRLVRNAIVTPCGTTRAFPGLQASTAGVRYETFTIGNPTAASTCVTVSLTPNCSEGTTSAYVFAAAYSGSFVPTNLATNYKTDMGSSPVGPTAISMGVTVAAGEVVVLVVNGLTAAGTCSSYSLTVAAPIALPVQVGKNAVAALTVYPNPVQDVLHIQAEKAGHYTLYNMQGEIVKQLTNTEVSVRDLPGGVYLLQQQETKAVTRIVKL